MTTRADPYGAPPMPDFFVRAACSWISPRAVADAARTLREAGGVAQPPTEFWFQSVEPIELRISALDSLVREYLARFYLPDDLIQLSRAFAPEDFDDGTLAALRALRFDGEVLDPEAADDVPSGGALIGIRAQFHLVLLVLRPVSVIVEEVSNIGLRYASWAAAQGEIPLITFEHSQAEAFATHIELTVARSMFGPRMRPHAWRGERVQRLAFPAFNVVTPAPVDAEFLHRARERARLLAAEQFKTLGSPQIQ